MAILGRESVLRQILSIQRTGELSAATLRRRGAADDFSVTQEYAAAYFAPLTEVSGIGGGAGYPDQTAFAYLFRQGETYTPRVDDQLTIRGGTYLILSVTTRQNADDGYAIYDLGLTDAL